MKEKNQKSRIIPLNNFIMCMTKWIFIKTFFFFDY